MKSQVILQDFFNVQGLSRAYPAAVLSRDHSLEEDIGDELHRLISKQNQNRIGEITNNIRSHFNPVDAHNPLESVQYNVDDTPDSRNLSHLVRELQLIKEEGLQLQKGLEAKLTDQMKTIKKRIEEFGHLDLGSEAINLLSEDLNLIFFTLSEMGLMGPSFEGPVDNHTLL